MTELASFNRVFKYKNEQPQAYTVHLEKVTPIVISTIRQISETRACFVCSIYDKTVQWFPIPAAVEYEETFQGKPLSLFKDKELFLNYRKQRETLICHCFCSPVVIVNEYRRDYIKWTIDKLTTRSYFVRQEIYFTCAEVENLLGRSCHRKQNGYPDTKCERKTYEGSYQTEPERENLVYPLHKTDYQNPMFPATNQEPKLSIQETDTSHSIDQRSTLSLERSFQPIVGFCQGYTASPDSKYLNSNICTNVGSRLTNYRSLSSGYQRSEASETSGGAAAAAAAASTRSEVSARRTTRHKYPMYQNYGDRLETYLTHHWNSTSKPEPKVLSEWGLFFTGKIDLVRCFSCGIGFKDWIKEDDPLSEHVRFSPHCYFMREELGHDQIQTLLESLLITDRTTDSSNSQLAQTQINGAVTEQHRNQQSDTLVPAHPPPFEVHNLRYQTIELRINSFKNRPSHMTQSPIWFAMAGLYYTGNDDLCLCFACGNGMNEWKPTDDPIEEHWRFYPECPYIKQVKGVPSLDSTRPSQKTVETLTKAPVPQSAARDEVNKITQQIDGITMNGAIGTHEIPGVQNGMASKRRWVINSLRTPAARSVLEMGYSREVVTRTIEKLEAQGKNNPNAQDIMEIILMYEDEDFAGL